MIRRSNFRSLSICAFAAACLLVAPAAAGAEVLYDQTDGAVPPTANSSGSDFSPSNELTVPDRTADDFTVPAGEKWAIDHIDVTGAYSGAPVSTVNVFLYADDGGKPGTELLAQNDIAATGGPNYSVPVTGAPQLGGGKYWMTVQQANLTGSDYWSWGTRSIVSGSPAQWRTAGGAPSCTANVWFQRSACWTSNNPDQTFKLSGTVTGRVPPPSSDFSFGKVKLNKKKGTAKLAVDVPNAGHIDASGKGVTKQSIDASGAGTVTVPIKPNGRVAKKLKKGGKATVNVDVTFTATGIAPNTETTKLKLKRKQKK